MPAAYQRYREGEIRSQNRVELVVKLYDGISRFLHKGREATIGPNPRPRDSMESVMRINMILDELTRTLNFQDGGEVAQTLFRFYNAFRYKLNIPEAHLQTETWDELIRLLEPVADAWRQVAKNERPGQNARPVNPAYPTPGAPPRP